MSHAIHILKREARILRTQSAQYEDIKTADKAERAYNGKRAADATHKAIQCDAAVRILTKQKGK